MKTIISLLLSSVLALSAKAQVIEFVKYKSEAQVIVHFVENKYEAKACVWEGPRWESKEHMGVWSYDSKDPYRIRVYITKYKHEADMVICVVENKWEIKVDENYKMLFYEEVD